MNKKSFLELAKEGNYQSSEIKIFETALDFSEKVMSVHKRLSGDTYFDHNMRVASTLVKSGSPPEIIIAALIHGTIKHVLKKDVLELFGKEILQLVEGVEDVKLIKSQNVALEAEGLRKILLTAIKDVRVILIKLADKLDNVHHIAPLSDKEKKRVAQEVLDVYAPLAYRLGVEKIKTDLEDSAFSILHPEEYKEIVEFLEASKEQREGDVTSAIEIIKSILKGITIEKIKGRPKHIYSIYKKVVNRGVPLDEQYDHLGIRIIAKEENDCYIILGRLHEHLEPVSGKLKDYISNPKPNGYQSIHTSVLFEGTKRLEIQIRTQQMEEFAEEGFAAHWRYKGLKSDERFERRMSWLKGVLELQKEATDKDFLENIKLDLFVDEIYCYTPKGDVKYLRPGATVLDFAYSVHEEIGNQTVGAWVNGSFVALKTEVKRGDVIDIVTSKNQKPRRNWLKFVQSSRAKQKIRKAVKLYQNLPALHYRTFKPTIQEEHDTLVHSPDYENASCILAKCCRPIPKQSIVGIITKRRLISVHFKECRMAAKEINRWVPVEWKGIFANKIRFFVVADERSGLLADLLHTIVRAQFQVLEAKAKIVGTGSSECSFVIAPKELDAIADLIERVMRVKGVKRIFFE